MSWYILWTSLHIWVYENALVIEFVYLFAGNGLGSIPSIKDVYKYSENYEHYPEGKGQCDRNSDCWYYCNPPCYYLTYCDMASHRCVCPCHNEWYGWDLINN